MIKKIIQFLLVLVLTWTIVFLARQDVNTFAYCFASFLVFMCVDIAYKYFVGDGKASEKITEGENIKFIDISDEPLEDTIREAIIETIKNHDTNYFLLCQKDNPTSLGLFGEITDNKLSMVAFTKIKKEGHIYKLYFGGFPKYILFTNDNGKIEEVTKLK